LYFLKFDGNAYDIGFFSP